MEKRKTDGKRQKRMDKPLSCGLWNDSIWDCLYEED